MATGVVHPAFTPLEKAVLAFVDDVVMNVRAGDQTLTGLAQHLPERQIVEGIMVAGCYRMLCMTLETCGVDIEEGGAAHSMSQKEWLNLINKTKGDEENGTQ